LIETGTLRTLALYPFSWMSAKVTSRVSPGVSFGSGRIGAEAEPSRAIIGWASRSLASAGEMGAARTRRATKAKRGENVFMPLASDCLGS
jgi:hypothetical protein